MGRTSSNVAPASPVDNSSQSTVETPPQTPLSAEENLTQCSGASPPRTASPLPREGEAKLNTPQAPSQGLVCKPGSQASTSARAVAGDVATMPPTTASDQEDRGTNTVRCDARASAAQKH